MKYICIPCGYIYEEEQSELLWSELPDEWICPDCGGNKDHFTEFEIEES